MPEPKLLTTQWANLTTEFVNGNTPNPTIRFFGGDVTTSPRGEIRVMINHAKGCRPEDVRVEVVVWISEGDSDGGVEVDLTKDVEFKTLRPAFTQLQVPFWCVMAFPGVEGSESMIAQAIAYASEYTVGVYLDEELACFTAYLGEEVYLHGSVPREQIAHYFNWAPPDAI